MSLWSAVVWLRLLRNDRIGCMRMDLVPLQVCQTIHRHKVCKALCSKMEETQVCVDLADCALYRVH